MDRRGKRLTDAELETLKRAFRLRTSPKIVANLLGISRRCVHKHYTMLAANQLPRPPRVRKKKQYEPLFYGPPTPISDWFVDKDGCLTRRIGDELATEPRPAGV